MRSEVYLRESGGKTVNSYDDMDRQIHRGDYDINGSLIQEVIYGYTLEGRDAGWISYDKQGNLLGRVEFLYSHYPQESEIHQFDSKNNLLRRTEYI